MVGIPPLLSQARYEGLLDIIEDSFLDKDKELRAALVLEKAKKPNFSSPRLPLFDLFIKVFPLQQFNARWYHQMQDWLFYLSLERDGKLVEQHDPKYSCLHRKFYMRDVKSDAEAIGQLEEASAFLERWYPLNHKPKVYQNGIVVSAR